MGTTTTLHVHHAFLYISLPSLHDCNLHFFFMEDVNERRQILPLFEFLGIQLPENSPTFDKVSELSNREED